MSKGFPRRLPAVLAVGLLAVAAAAAPSAQAKSVKITKQVNAPIPDRGPGGGVFGQLLSTINVGNQFKKMKIRDVNVTFQATGNTGAAPITDLVFQLTAPNGATTMLFGAGGIKPPLIAPIASLGPATADDESPLHFSLATFGVTADQTALYEPWVGTAQPSGKPLALMDNGRVKGTWTLRVQDVTSSETSVLNSWRLNVVAGKPYKTS